MATQIFVPQVDWGTTCSQTTSVISVVCSLIIRLLVFSLPDPFYSFSLLLLSLITIHGVRRTGWKSIQCKKDREKFEQGCVETSYHTSVILQIIGLVPSKQDWVAWCVASNNGPCVDIHPTSIQLCRPSQLPMILNTQTSLGWHTHNWQAHKFWRHALISLCCSHTQTLIPVIGTGLLC